MTIAKKLVRYSRLSREKQIPGEVATLRESFVLTCPCCVDQATCKYSSQLYLLRLTLKTGEVTQRYHLLSVARLEKGSVGILAYMVKFEKPPNGGFFHGLMSFGTCGIGF